jgi:nucleoside-diphosphate kinase
MKRSKTTNKNNRSPGTRIDLQEPFWYCSVKTKPIERNRKMQRTLSIIKPDGVGRGLIGEVVRRLEKNGLKIIAMKMIHMTRRQAEGFYAVHKERPFFKSLIDFMTSGPLVVMVLEGEDVIARYRKLMGATDYKQAEEGTIRKEFATDIEKNVVHGSDGPDTAAFEIGYFFNSFEIVG